MKVLFVNRPDADSRYGGDTVQMRETAKALGAMGHEVEERLGTQPEEAYKGWDVVHLFNLQTPDFTLGEMQKAKAAGAVTALSTIFWDFGAELLLAESGLWRKVSGVVGQKLALNLARRRVNSAAAVDRSKMALILELADVCLPNSEAEIAHLHRLTKKIKASRVVPNAVDSVRFDPEMSLPLPAWASSEGIRSEDYLLVAARIDHHKNQVPFCRAVQGLGIKVVLAGQGEQELVRQCEEAGAMHVGPLSGDDLAAAFRHARVHALPSFRETPGLASLEAAAMGCAIVSTENGSAYEYFQDDAFYCRPDSGASMAKAVQLAWKSGRQTSLSARIRSKCTWEGAARETFAAYCALLGRSSDLRAE